MGEIFCAVISIDSVRLAGFRSRHEGWSNDFHVFGVRGVDIPAGDYFSHAVQGRLKVLTPGELGCARSHLDAYKAFLETDAKYLLVAEDDVELFVDSSSLIRMIRQVDTDCWLLHLGGMNKIARSRLLGRRDTQGLGLWYLPSLSWRWVWMACGYVVDRSMAKAILAEQSRYLRVADAWGEMITRIGSGSVYFSDKSSHSHGNSSSHLASDRTNDRHILSVIIRKLFGVACWSFLRLLGYSPVEN